MYQICYLIYINFKHQYEYMNMNMNMNMNMYMYMNVNMGVHNQYLNVYEYTSKVLKMTRK
jgi:hypothetical protein